MILCHTVPGDQTCTERESKVEFVEQLITKRALAVPDQKLLPHGVTNMNMTTLVLSISPDTRTPILYSNIRKGWMGYHTAV